MRPQILVAQILVALAALLGPLGCGSRSDAQPNGSAVTSATDSTASTASSAAPSAAPANLPQPTPGHAILGLGDTVPDASVYALRTPLLDQEGRSITLDVFRGQLVLVSMFYSSCPSACPTLISNIKKVVNGLSDTDRESVRVLLVSFDAERDTPEVLRTLLERHQVSADGWRFASATDDGAREVSAVLGIKYRGADGTFNHSSVITLLDREGKIDLRVDGMADVERTVGARIHELAQQ